MLPRAAEEGRLNAAMLPVWEASRAMWKITNTPPFWYCAFWTTFLVVLCVYLYALKRWL